MGPPLRQPVAHRISAGDSRCRWQVRAALEPTGPPLTLLAQSGTHPAEPATFGARRQWHWGQHRIDRTHGKSVRTRRRSVAAFRARRAASLPREEAMPLSPPWAARWCTARLWVSALFGAGRQWQASFKPNPALCRRLPRR
jgi:hypothetical protein